MDFTKTRIPFIAISDKEVHFQNPPTGCDAKEWAAQEFNISEETWAQAVRGYIMKDRVQFFTGHNYSQAHVRPRVLLTVVDFYESVFGCKPTCYYNGVVVGKPGTVWEPVSSYSLEEYV